MKALSVKQPWANMITDGEKTIETRTWSTSYRGPLLIVSSKVPDFGMCASLPVSCEPVGHAIAVVTIADCRPMTREDERAAWCTQYPGAMAWLLKNIRRIKPFPVRGSRRLFKVDITENQLEYL